MNKKPNQTWIKYTQRYALIGALFGATFPIIATLLRMLISQIPLNISAMFTIQRSDPILWVVDTAPIVLGLIAGYAGHKQDMLSKINEELHDRERELKTNQLNLEQYVNERTAELSLANQRNERRSAQFEAIARVARTIRSSQTLDTLLPQITEAISEQFGFYHTGIFLLNNSKEYAILVAANSEGGKRMLERNHRLSVGGTGIVGFVTGSGQPRVALNVGLDAAYFNNPDLPNTHSEIAIPLRTSAELFGALDVQSTEANAFSQEDVSLLSALADQVSIAIQNARSLQQSREALAQIEASSAQVNKQRWSEFLEQQMVGGFTFDGIDTKKLTPSDKRVGQSLVIPLVLRGIRIGTMKLNPAADSNRKWTEDEIAIAQATADRAALAVESARLLLEAQKRAAKERAVGQISAKIGSLVNLESILQTAIQELGNTLQDTDIAIQFQSRDMDRR